METLKKTVNQESYISRVTGLFPYYENFFDNESDRPFSYIMPPTNCWGQVVPNLLVPYNVDTTLYEVGGENVSDKGGIENGVFPYRTIMDYYYKYYKDSGIVSSDCYHWFNKDIIDDSDKTFAQWVELGIGRFLTPVNTEISDPYYEWIYLGLLSTYKEEINKEYKNVYDDYIYRQERLCAFNNGETDKFGFTYYALTADMMADNEFNDKTYLYIDNTSVNNKNLSIVLDYQSGDIIICNKTASTLNINAYIRERKTFQGENSVNTVLDVPVGTHIYHLQTIGDSDENNSFNHRFNLLSVDRKELNPDNFDIKEVDKGLCCKYEKFISKGGWFYWQLFNSQQLSDFVDSIKQMFYYSAFDGGETGVSSSTLDIQFDILFSNSSLDLGVLTPLTREWDDKEKYYPGDIVVFTNGEEDTPKCYICKKQEESVRNYILWNQSVINNRPWRVSVNDIEFNNCTFRYDMSTDGSIEMMFPRETNASVAFNLGFSPTKGHKYLLLTEAILLPAYFTLKLGTKSSSVTGYDSYAWYGAVVEADETATQVMLGVESLPSSWSLQLWHMYVIDVTLMFGGRYLDDIQFMMAKVFDIAETIRQYVTPELKVYVDYPAYTEGGGKTSIDGSIYGKDKSPLNSDYWRLLTHEASPWEYGDTYELTGKTHSKLQSLRRVKDCFNEYNERIMPKFPTDWLCYYRIGATNINHQEIGSETYYYGDYLESAVADSTTMTIKFTYWIDALLDKDANGVFSLNTDSNNGMFNGVKYVDTYKYIEGSDIDKLFSGNFTINGTVVDAERYLRGEYDVYKTYGAPNEIARYFYENLVTFEFDGSENVKTITVTDNLASASLRTYIECEYFKKSYYSGLDDLDYSYVVHHPYDLRMSSKPIISSEVIVDRGNTQAFEKHIRLSEVKTLEDMTNFNNGSFFNQITI